jgi:hypothetical protein
VLQGLQKGAGALYVSMGLQKAGTIDSVTKDILVLFILQNFIFLKNLHSFSEPSLHVDLQSKIRKITTTTKWHLLYYVLVFLE